MYLPERIQQRTTKRRNCRSDFRGEAESWGSSSWRRAGSEGGLITVCEYPRWVGVLMRGSGSSWWCPVQWAQIKVQEIKPFGNWVTHSSWPCFEKRDLHDLQRFLRSSAETEMALSGDCLSSSEISVQRYLVVFWFCLYTCLFFHLSVLILDSERSRSCSDLRL